MVNKGLMSSDSNEWYTPLYVTNFLEVKYGKIILDPCAAKTTTIGEINYTIEDDGLSKEWDKKVVFVNPPYGREIQEWVKKSMLQQKKYNNIIILLIPARTDTTYWHDFIFPYYSEIYFIKGRIKFETVHGVGESAPFPSAIIVFSENKNKTIKSLKITSESYTQYTLFTDTL